MMDFSGWESPVNIIQTQMRMEMEGDIMRAVQNVGVIVDKEELVKAIQHDRGQYDKGFMNGYNKAIDDFVERLNEKCDAMIKEKWNSNVAPISWAEAYSDFKDDIDELAEQLKAGRENE